MRSGCIAGTGTMSNQPPDPCRSSLPVTSANAHPHPASDMLAVRLEKLVPPSGGPQPPISNQPARGHTQKKPLSTVPASNRGTPSENWPR